MHHTHKKSYNAVYNITKQNKPFPDIEVQIRNGSDIGIGHYSSKITEKKI